MGIISMLLSLLLATHTNAEVIYPTPPIPILANYGLSGGNYDLNNDNFVNTLDLSEYFSKQYINVDLPNSAGNLSCNEICHNFASDQEASLGTCLSVGLSWISGTDDGLYWQYLDQECHQGIGASCNTVMVAQGNSNTICGPFIMQEYRPMWTNCHCKIIM